MYTPAHFSLTDSGSLHGLIRSYPLGTLVTQANGVLDANHLPFLLDAAPGEMGTLSAHVARANPIWQQCRDGAEVLVIFRGAEGYISPSWYPSKHETHRLVPTWNYEAVHVHGQISIHDDEKFVRGLVGRLTRVHEASQAQPWKMSDSPREFIDGMLQAIVGLQIRITRLEGKAKLSQNRQARDLEGAIGALRERGQEPLAGATDAAPRI